MVDVAGNPSFDDVEEEEDTVVVGSMTEAGRMISVHRTEEDHRKPWTSSSTHVCLLLLFLLLLNFF